LVLLPLFFKEVRVMIEPKHRMKNNNMIKPKQKEFRA
jgi:hypothetical protein